MLDQTTGVLSPDRLWTLTDLINFINESQLVTSSRVTSERRIERRYLRPERTDKRTIINKPTEFSYCWSRFLVLFLFFHPYCGVIQWQYLERQGCNAQVYSLKGASHPILFGVINSFKMHVFGQWEEAGESRKPNQESKPLFLRDTTPQRSQMRLALTESRW